MRLVRSIALALVCCTAAASTAAAGDQVILVVRHAERADTPGQPAGGSMMMANDPALSPAGKERAARLATMLASAEIAHIFTTEYQRTRQTASPVAEKLKIQPVVSPAKDSAPLIEQVLKASGNVLIVGHSNTVPDVLKRLGVTQEIVIPDNEYDSLFVVIRHATGVPTLIRLRY